MSSKLSQSIPEVDTHTHTVISGHAWSTVTENAAEAAAKGMKGICLTEHGPGVPGGAPVFAPHSQLMIPETVGGIRIYKGMEVNIMDIEGNLDIPEKQLQYLEFGIASFHAGGSTGIVAGTEAQNTEAYIKTLQNPWIDTIGHADEPRVPCDLEAVVLEAGRLGKLIELNNKRVPSGDTTGTRAEQYALLCKKHNQRVCVGTDAHFHTMIGDASRMLAMLERIDFPPELIVNLTMERFEGYLQERKERLKAFNI